MSYMTPAHVARLRADVQDFIQGKQKVTLTEVATHVQSRGWNVVHGEMFSEWLLDQGFHVAAAEK